MTIDRETIEALHGEPELLAIADAVQSVGPQLGQAPAPPRRRRPVRLVAVALAAAAIVGVVLASPWDTGGTSFVDKALAAVGNRPVLHMIVRQTVGERVDLRTGRSSPTHRDLELWYDQQRHVFRTEARLDGRVILSRARRGNLGRSLQESSTLYRKALREGKVHKIGDAVLHGRHVIVVEARSKDGLSMRADLDASTYGLVRMQIFVRGRLGSETDVLKFETITRAQAHLPKNPPVESNSSTGSATLTYPSGGSTGASTLTLAEARRTFSIPALWPGRFVGGHRLKSVNLPSVTDESQGSTVHGRMLGLAYGPDPLEDEPFLEIDEAPASDAALWKAEDVFPPPPGYVDLLGGETSSDGHTTRTQWTGVMRKAGFFLRLTSFSRSTLIAAARAMRPVT